MNADQTAHEPAMPSTLEAEYEGLSKREHYAALAMQGLLANRGTTTRPDTDGYREIATVAVGLADALHEALNK